MASLDPLSREDLIKSLVARLNIYLDMIDSAGLAGSVVAEIHRAPDGHKKIRIGLTENWSPGDRLHG